MNGNQGGEFDQIAGVHFELCKAASGLTGGVVDLVREPPQARGDEGLERRRGEVGRESKASAKLVKFTA